MNKRFSFEKNKTDVTATNFYFKPVATSKFWRSLLFDLLFASSSLFTAPFLVVLGCIAFQTATPEKPWFEIFNQYYGFLAVGVLIAEIVAMQYLHLWNKKNVSKPNYQAFSKWLKENHDLTLHKNQQFSSIRTPPVYDILLKNKTVINGSCLFIKKDGSRVTHTVIITKEGLTLADAVEDKETLIKTESSNVLSNRFYLEVLDTICVSDLHKHLEKEDCDTVRNITRTMKNVSRLDLDIEDQHIIMRAAEELTKLNRNVKSLASLNAVENSLNVIKQIINQLDREVQNVCSREIDKIEQELLTQLSDFNDDDLNNSEGMKKDKSESDDGRHSKELFELWAAYGIVK